MIFKYKLVICASWLRAGCRGEYKNYHTFGKASVGGCLKLFTSDIKKHISYSLHDAENPIQLANPFAWDYNFWVKKYEINVNL